MKLTDYALTFARQGLDDESALEGLREIQKAIEPGMAGEKLVDLWESAKRVGQIGKSSVAERTREYVASVTNASFSVTNVSEVVTDAYIVSQSEHSVTKRDMARIKGAVRKELSRLKQAGVILAGKRDGEFLIPQAGIRHARKLSDIAIETEDIILPFKLSLMARIFPGNLIVVAGEPNSGKTALMLNFLKDNMHSYDVHYFNSEMEEEELKDRLEKFENIDIRQWEESAHFYTGMGDFTDAIEKFTKPQRGVLYLFDFLEIEDNFYKVGAELNRIWRKLNGGIAVVAIQKNPGSSMGLGGRFSLDKPKLYLALSRGVAKIVKLKAWKTNYNPNGMITQFNIINGCLLRMIGDWQNEEKT